MGTPYNGLYRGLRLKEYHFQDWRYTAVSTKVQQKKRKSVRDNAERSSGKCSINALKAQNPFDFF